VICLPSGVSDTAIHALEQGVATLQAELAYWQRFIAQATSIANDGSAAQPSDDNKMQLYDAWKKHLELQQQSDTAIARILMEICTVCLQSCNAG
jgi:hypothetical protein